MIHVQGAGKKFDEHWIFRNIHMHVAPSQCAVLIGPSGTGKSVLFKMISGLLPVDEGKISVNSPEIGMLFQKNALFDSLSVEENLLLPLKEVRKTVGKEARTLAANWLGEVGLDGMQFLKPSELSGGMQKRLGIARVLILEPEVILYDDPTAGLDPITSRRIADLILSLQNKRRSTSIVITNDMQRAFQLGDQVYLLANGDLVSGGNREEIKASQDERIQQFIYGLPQGPLNRETQYL